MVIVFKSLNLGVICYAAIVNSNRKPEGVTCDGRWRMQFLMGPETLRRKSLDHVYKVQDLDRDLHR